MHGPSVVVAVPREPAALVERAEGRATTRGDLHGHVGRPGGGFVLAERVEECATYPVASMLGQNTEVPHDGLDFAVGRGSAVDYPDEITVYVRLEHDLGCCDAVGHSTGEAHVHEQLESRGVLVFLRDGDDDRVHVATVGPSRALLRGFALPGGVARSGRAAQLAAARTLLASGQSAVAVARTLGVSRSNLYRAMERENVTAG